MNLLDSGCWVKGEGNFIEVKNIDEVCTKFCENIKVLFKHAKEMAESAQEETNALREEKWKDEELQKMKEERDKAIADMRRGFDITEEESKAIHEWKTNHNEYFHNGRMRGGAIGGNYTYHFTPTSIGVIGSICCTSCKNMAHYESGNSRDYVNFQAWNKQVDENMKTRDAEFVFRELS